MWARRRGNWRVSPPDHMISTRSASLGKACAPARSQVEWIHLANDRCEIRICVSVYVAEKNSEPIRLPPCFSITGSKNLPRVNTRDECVNHLGARRNCETTSVYHSGPYPVWGRKKKQKGYRRREGRREEKKKKTLPVSQTHVNILCISHPSGMKHRWPEVCSQRFTRFHMSPHADFRAGWCRCSWLIDIL